MKVSKPLARKLGLPIAGERRKYDGKAGANKAFDKLCRAHGLPAPVHEYQFHTARKWRADYAFPDLDVLVEIEGGCWVQGRHTRGKGFCRDLEKYAEAAILGWYVIRATPQMVEDGTLFDWLKRMAYLEGA